MAHLHQLARATPRPCSACDPQHACHLTHAASDLPHAWPPGLRCLAHAGIAEDPVTGSAHSVLGPYWAAALGTPRLRARQCSPRGGELGVEVRAEQGRVVVSGGAVTVFKGHLFLPD